jgi:hypothetical protein
MTNPVVTRIVRGPQGVRGGVDAHVVNFADVAGADRTGAATSDAAFDALIALAAPTFQIEAQIPAWSTFRLDEPKAYNPQWLSFRALGGPFQCEFDCTNATVDGPMFPIAKPDGSNRPCVPMEGIFLSGPTDPATTVDCFELGGPTTFANQLEFRLLEVNGFRDQIVDDGNLWCLTWRKCNFRAHTRTHSTHQNTIGGSGEGIRYDNCTIHGGLTGSLVFDLNSTTTTITLVNTSLDYNAKIGKITEGQLIIGDGCHIESDNTNTATEMFELVIGNAYNPALRIHHGTFVPLYTTAGNCRTLVRITGNGAATNSQAVVEIADMHIVNGAGCAGANALVIDDSTGSSASSASKQSRVCVRGLSYKDASGTPGLYYPFYVKDRAARKLLCNPAIDYGDVTYNGLARIGDSATIHVYESIPHNQAVDKFQILSGDTYLVRIPVTDLGGWSATAFDMMLAIEAVGVTLTAFHVALYDLGPDSGLLTSFARIGTAQALTLNSGASAIKTVNQTLAMQMTYPRSNIFMGVALTGATIPELYGVKVAAASPLVDPAGTKFPIKAVRYTGAVGLPGSLTVASGLKADFVPWLAIKPTVYV